MFDEHAHAPSRWARLMDAVERWMGHVHRGAGRRSLGFVVMVVYHLVYFAATRTYLQAPRVLRLGFVDRLVPLLPWTVYVYLSDFALFAATYWLLTDDARRVRYLAQVTIVFGAACIVFIVVPVAYPRELFPVPEACTDAACALLRHVRSTDAATGAFPSLHVAVSMLSPLSFARRRENVRFVMTSLWFAAIAFSTLTTKQHYLLDVLAGSALAYVVSRWTTAKCDRRHRR